MKRLVFLSLYLTLCLWISGVENQEVKMDLDYENVTPRWKVYEKNHNSHNKVKYKEMFDAFRGKLRALVEQHVAENKSVKKNGIDKDAYPQWLSLLTDLGATVAQGVESQPSGNLKQDGLFEPRQVVRQPASGSLASPQGSVGVLGASGGEGGEDPGRGQQQERAQRAAREAPGVMYLPVQSGSSSCPSYADTVASSLTQMAFASMVVTVFNAVANIANNINNNNRNDNINSNSNVDSNNANVASNSNNGNQVNVVLPPPIPGRKRQVDLKRKRRHILQLKRISGKLREMQGSRFAPEVRGSSSHAPEMHGIRPAPDMQGSRFAPEEKQMKGASTGQVESTGDKCMSRKAHAQAALATLSVVKSLLLPPGITSRGAGHDNQDPQDPPFPKREIRQHHFWQTNDPHKNATVCHLQHLCTIMGSSALQEDLVSHVTVMARLRDAIISEGVSTGSATPIPVTCSSLTPFCPARP
ncbi:uncharacterized protein LOC122246335 [Penaeus japonicus]|uniref:uncharacterized protein LOC122246335 n=1 Tax=Penaeus japonicus TaxID=27405 RepID=UPI001C7113F6|nr:uncharacterized protein LOC122246335 [Penaeus japonicus]